MRFALSGEQRQFAASLHELLSAVDTPAATRAWARGRHEPGLELWHRLAGLGVLDLLDPGTGAEPPDVAVAFEALGYHAVPGPLVESMVVAPVLSQGNGEIVTVLAPPEVPVALDADIAGLILRLRDGRAARVEAAELDRIRSIDPARRLFRVRGGREVPMEGGGDRPAAKAFDYAVLAVAAQLVGAGQWLLDTAVEYARRRSQYGRPIGQYQAIKHLLADVVTRLEFARPLVYGAAVALQDAENRAGAVRSGTVRWGTLTRDVSAAKVAAGEAAYLAARTALQVHGAIGYTAEHDLGLWLTKVRALVGAWGGAGFHRGRVLAALRSEAP
ncbi:MAG TPA: acyl-CoA dehydrogenase family protein [Amycolatopsis sp.]|nr:acyl-CoA dehydrogenase family protein [Amycolatopsis sp.]